MILYTPQIQRRPEKRKVRVSAGRNRRTTLIALLKIMALLVAVFLVATGHVLCKSEVERLNRRALRLESDINSLGRKVANLQIRREEHMGKHILEQVRNLGIALRYPVAGQVRSIRASRRIEDLQDIGNPGEILLTRR
ncbi:MAG: hypothetical protein JW808_10295 [Victivallales bacterium]|nr:hypothetical protein [Victivallales bacterium]